MGAGQGIAGDGTLESPSCNCVGIAGHALPERVLVLIITTTTPNIAFHHSDGAGKTSSSTG